MKIAPYLSSVLPSFEKSHILGDLSRIGTEYRDITIPAYKNSLSVFKGVNFKNKVLVEWDDDFHRVDTYKSNIINTIYLSISGLPKVCDDLADLADTFFARDVLAGNMTYVRVNLLQYIEMMTFVSMYSRRFLLMAYTLETDMLDHGKVDYVASRDYKYLRNRYEDFVRCINIIGDTSKNIKKAFDKIPEITVTPTSVGMHQELVGISKTDPFGFGFIATRFNPIYHIRMAIATYQIKQYQLAKADKVTLELKLINLKQARDGKQTAANKKAIEYTQKTIDDLQYSIDKTERDANG